MGGSRGLMGPEAFVQLRAMVDNLLSKKADCSDDGVSAVSAAKLKTARKITFTGAATGSATFDGSDDVTVDLAASASAAGFLQAHPVGCVYMTTVHTNPGTLYGGTWVERPSVGAFLYERTA